MKKKLNIGGILILSSLILFYSSSPVSAAFKSTELMDDVVFGNYNNMSASQIDNFLNTQPNSCISTNSGFEAAQPTGYTPAGGFTFGGYVSAGQVIATAAQVYEVNPRALITTLEKEQSLVTGQKSATYCLPSLSGNHKYAAAAGYGCPDSVTTHSYTGLNLYKRSGTVQTDVNPTCVNSPVKAGFSQQVIRAAWLLKFGQQRSMGNTAWNIQKPGWDNSDDPLTCYGGPMTTGNRKRCSSDVSTVFYDGYTTIDGVSTHMDTGITAALYWYTPHFHGNQLFVSIYEGWFGSTLTNEEGYMFVTSSASSLTYSPGDQGSISITIKNTGFKSWYSDNNLPAGQQPTRLATIGYQNTPFADTTDSNWLGTRNQVKMTPDMVLPGDNATFTFTVIAPYLTTTYHNHFVPIVGGAFLRDVGMDIPLTSVAPAWNPLSTTVDIRDLLPNQQSHFIFTVQNNGKSNWYSDNNLPTNKQPTRLASIGYENSPFADTADPNWLGTRNQVKMTPDVVHPGETATFSAWFIAPISNKPVASKFHFAVIVGGVFTPDMGLVIPFTTPTADLSYAGVSASNPPATMLINQIAVGMEYVIKNTGNVVWQDESYQNGAHALRLIMNHPVYRSSPFYNVADNEWLSIGQIAKQSGTTMPGQNATFSFTWKAPGAPGVFHEPFQPAVGGLFLKDYGAAFDTTVN